MSSTKFVFFRPIGKIRWPPCPLIGWDIFDFSSETAEPNSTKLIRKQDLNILYQVCVFQAYQKNKMAALASDRLRHFLLSSETAERNSTKLDRKQDLNILYQVCVFWANWKIKMATLASDWLRYLWLLLWNWWTEFNKLDRKQDLMSSSEFVFFGLIGKTRWPPWPLIGWNIFDFSSETAERNSTKLDRKQDLNVLYQSVFFGLISKQKCMPWPIPKKSGTLYSGARYVALWASCQFDMIYLCVLQGEIQALFLRHEGYLGAIGAFLKGAQEEGMYLKYRCNMLWMAQCSSGQCRNGGVMVKHLAYVARMFRAWAKL